MQGDCCIGAVTGEQHREDALCASTNWIFDIIKRAGWERFRDGV